MPCLEAPIAEDAPIVGVTVWIEAEHERALKSRRLPRPNPFCIRGLIDTGAREPNYAGEGKW
jgi:hypothetical protein